MTSKSELKRRSTLDPLWAAQRISDLEKQLEATIEVAQFRGVAAGEAEEKLAAAEKEANENARIIGMSGEREALYLAKIEALKSAYSSVRRYIFELEPHCGCGSCSMCNRCALLSKTDRLAGFI